jgi:hypothetical protein
MQKKNKSSDSGKSTDVLCLVVRLRWQFWCYIISKKLLDFAKKYKCNYMAFDIEHKVIR